jgi:hypothetical protein
MRSAEVNVSFEKLACGPTLLWGFNAMVDRVTDQVSQGILDGLGGCDAIVTPAAD